MAIFRGYKIKTGKNAKGEEKFIDVPVSYGSKDRVTAAILNNNTQNLPLRLPVIITQLTNISLAVDRFKGIDAVRKINYVPRGQVFPDDITTVTQIMPVPYKLTLDVVIYTSNFDTHLQILEQVLVLFNPSVQIQLSDSDFDMGKITTVELTNIAMEENFPVSTSSRMMITTLTFEVIAYLTVPARVRDEAIKEIHVRIGAVSREASTDEDILTELDNQLTEHLIINIDDVLN
jgi:hypothetical protein